MPAGWPSPALASPLPFQIKPSCSWYWLGGAQSLPVIRRGGCWETAGASKMTVIAIVFEHLFTEVTGLRENVGYDHKQSATDTTNKDKTDKINTNANRLPEKVQWWPP